MNLDLINRYLIQKAKAKKMKNHFELFEEITFFGEIAIGQIGFQVIAISLGRRGSGEWKTQDSIRFMAMLSTSIFATLLCYAPFYTTIILIK